jgi:cystathionine gamma-lyase
MSEPEGFGTRAIHAGQAPDPTTGAIMTPVFQTSTYAQESPGVIKGRYDYSRSANPTRDALEANLASLEGARHGVCFSSGCAALAAVLHLLESGDHVVLSDDVYGGTFRLVENVFSQLGISATRVDMTDPALTEAAITDRTRLIWAETPSNPMLKVVDIRATAELAQSRLILFAVDNTFATPFLQNPLALGADIVCHSSTKYLGGHSDVIGGALVTNDDALAERLSYLQNAVGAVPAPWDCFLLLRSTKTLHVRMERHCENARRVAACLAERPEVERVVYPGLEDHPQHAIAARQMRDFGGMITVVLAGGIDRARRFLESVELFTLGESLGGVESLIEHPAIMTHASIPPDEREAIGILDGLVRLSVGIEDVEDLVLDLTQALEAT